MTDHQIYLTGLLETEHLGSYPWRFQSSRDGKVQEFVFKPKNPGDNDQAATFGITALARIFPGEVML